MNRFFLAEKLGMTVSELGEKMTYEEMHLWLVFYDIKQEEEEKARRRAMVRR